MKLSRSNKLIWAFFVLAIFWSCAAFAQTTETAASTAKPAAEQTTAAAAVASASGMKQFVRPTNWWLPASASTFAPEIDRIFYLILWVTGIVFVIVEVMLVYFLIKYRAKPGVRAKYLHGNHKLELIWTAVPSFILIVLALMSQITWASVRYPTHAPTNGMKVEVMGEQFAWNVRFAGPDGKFGRTDASKMSSENPWGRVEGDADGKDDIITINDLHIPSDQPCKLLLTSKDVIHSFFLPEFRFKQDAVPGLGINVWFQPTMEGEFEIACAEFCGLGHYRMRGNLTVDSPAKFQEWLKANAPSQ